MIESFAKLGESLKVGFGLGNKLNTKNGEPKKYFSDYLNYRKFKSDLNVFENKSTYGFALKLRPFCGIGIDDVSALKKIVSYEIPSSAVV